MPTYDRREAGGGRKEAAHPAARPAATPKNGGGTPEKPRPERPKPVHPIPGRPYDRRPPGPQKGSSRDQDSTKDKTQAAEAQRQEAENIRRLQERRQLLEQQKQQRKSDPGDRSHEASRSTGRR